MTHQRLLLSAGLFLMLTATAASAEPMFLSKQYARCTACHYSPTGGGLLTPYGRSLSRRELSTMGKGAPESARGEESFLYGVLGKAVSTSEHVQLGVDLRPARLHFSVAGFESDRNLLMNADVLGAVTFNGWTLYGQVGRQLKDGDPKLGSYEYWLAHQRDNGFGIRAGRFLPAFGIRFADHTAFNRITLGLDTYDQIYGVEISWTAARHLLQLSAGPGHADAIIDNDGRQAFTASGRFQIEIGQRMSLVASGLYRDESDLEPRSGASGLAFGFAPTTRLNIWTEADTRFEEGPSGGRAYIVVNETAFEAVRGVWLKFSPQIRTLPGDSSGGLVRAVFEADVLPRTHWNVDASYYIDQNRASDIVSKTFLIQLHLYL